MAPSKRGAAPLPHAIGQLSKRPLVRVIAGAIVRLKRTTRRRVGQIYVQLAKLRTGITLGWIVGQQILSSQFVTDLLKGTIQLRRRRRVIILAARIRRDLDQRVLAPRVASRVRFNGYDDDAINNRLRLLRCARRKRRSRLFIASSSYPSKRMRDETPAASMR